MNDTVNTKTKEIMITTEVKKGDVVIEDTVKHSSEKIVLTESMVKQPVNLNIELGITRPLKQKFSSVRISVGLQTPSSLATLDDDYKKASAWIEEKITEQLATVDAVYSQKQDIF